MKWVRANDWWPLLMLIQGQQANERVNERERGRLQERKKTSAKSAERARRLFFFKWRHLFSIACVCERYKKREKIGQENSLNRSVRVKHKMLLETDQTARIRLWQCRDSCVLTVDLHAIYLLSTYWPQGFLPVICDVFVCVWYCISMRSQGSVNLQMHHD